MKKRFKKEIKDRKKIKTEIAQNMNKAKNKKEEKERWTKEEEE